MWCLVGSTSPCPLQYTLTHPSYGCRQLKFCHRWPPYVEGVLFHIHRNLYYTVHNKVHAELTFYSTKVSYRSCIHVRYKWISYKWNSAKAVQVCQQELNEIKYPTRYTLFVGFCLQSSVFRLNRYNTNIMGRFSRSLHIKPNIKSK